MSRCCKMTGYKTIRFESLLIFLTFISITLGYSLKGGDNLKDRYLVNNLPGLHDNIPEDNIPLMYAGQLEIFKENDTHLFFWKFSDNKIIPEYKKRTIFWLNGGPGCSSMDGALMEAGPFRINNDKKVEYNSGSWHKAGDIVFVDQPAGTGFSYTKEYDHDLDQIVWQFLKFMQEFFKLFPEDRDNEIYFAGESYAGQYIPYIANGILDFNKNLNEGEQPYNLKGLLIGNGWIAPDTQGLSYLPYAMAAGIIDKTNPNWNDVLRQHEKCQNVVNSVSGDKMSDFQIVSDTCEVILSKLLYATKDNDAASNKQCYNMYDYTLKDSYPSCGMNWPPDLANVDPFLDLTEVQTDLNLILYKNWHECSSKVSNRFRARNSVPAIKLLPRILSEIPIVLFNGNRDIICNYIGTENFIKELEWNGAKGFRDDIALDWIYDNDISGYIKSDRNLTFVNVFDSSHMVPFDKPEVSRSLIDILNGNYDITDYKQNDGTTKKTIRTFPLGVRKQAVGEEGQSSSTITSSSPTSETMLASTTTGTMVSTSTLDPSQNSDLKDENNQKEASSTRITRIIQLMVLIILIWGIYKLYSHYRSRPSSIIKTRPSSRKKNVQWADQLRQFQTDENYADDGSQINHEPGFIMKTLRKFMVRDNRSQYRRVDDEMGEDIELSDNLTNDVNEFIIDSDDEQQPYESQPSSAGRSTSGTANNEVIDSK